MFKYTALSIASRGKGCEDEGGWAPGPVVRVCCRIPWWPGVLLGCPGASLGGARPRDSPWGSAGLMGTIGFSDQACCASSSSLDVGRAGDLAVWILCIAWQCWWRLSFVCSVVLWSFDTSAALLLFIHFIRFILALLKCLMQFKSGGKRLWKIEEGSACEKDRCWNSFSWHHPRKSVLHIVKEMSFLLQIRWASKAA